MRIARKKQVPWNKGKKLPQFSGKNGSNWKGGRIIHLGYIRIYKPNHPYADKQGYVREHRLVVERYIKRYLKPNEHIHHISDRDNNNIQLLIGFSSFAAHINFHRGITPRPGDIIFDGRTLGQSCRPLTKWRER